MISLGAIASIATPVGKVVARGHRTCRHLGAGSSSLGVLFSARAVSSQRFPAVGGALATWSEGVRSRARTVGIQYQVARGHCCLPFRADGRRCSPFGYVAGRGASAGVSRRGLVKRFSTARSASSGDGWAFSSDSEEGRGSGSRNFSGGGGGDGVAVFEDGSEKYLVAARVLEAGHVVFARVRGSLVGEATRHSVQVGEELHLDAENELRFFNHACEPNCQLEVEAADSTGGQARSPCLRVKVRAPRVEINEPLTVDYNAMELDMSSPFDCNCGADRCRGRVSGFANLPPAEQREYLDGRWKTRSTPADPAPIAAATDGGAGIGKAVAEGSERNAMGPAPLTHVVKKWAEENTTNA